MLLRLLATALSPCPPFVCAMGPPSSVYPSAVYSVTPWEVSFLDPLRQSRNALIVLNQPFSFPLLHRVWQSSTWHACADGGANRLHDLLSDHDGRDLRHL